MTDYNQAWAFVAALAGDPQSAVMDWRAIHDANDAIPALIMRDTLPNVWQWAVTLNGQGYGIFATVAAMNGEGRHLEHVDYLRANYVDLDSINAPADFERASAAQPAPSFAVQTSPEKFHVYWPLTPYRGNDRFQLVQRKLRQVFNGDKRVIDAARVMRVPGTFNNKYCIPGGKKYNGSTAPHLVTCWSLPGYGNPTTVEALEAALASVNIVDGGVGTRHDLGEPSLAAPSLAWVKRGLELVDPNDLDRGEWIAITAGMKQAAWSLADPDTVFAIWSEWCARYDKNDPGENLKQWADLRRTELGWPSLVNRIPALKALVHLGGADKSAQVPQAAPDAPAVPGMPPVAAAAPPMPEPPPLDCSGPFLTHLEQQEWFKDCVFVTNLGEMMTPNGRFLNVSQFNALYGGKYFIIDGEGKKTNEAWSAATRSTLWTVPKVDHVRFLPDEPFGAIVVDDLGRKGVNTYRPIIVPRQQGDVGPFLRHIAALLPDPVDQKILLDYLAHNARFPGHKIPWAPVIQSTEGAGKGVIKAAMKHVMGRSYTYFPKANELSESGAKFNAWMRRRLFILVDEIKVDDRRELIEILKPLISEKEAEIQAKGFDQDLEDNFSNWLFFTNFKDAVPINKNGRRFALMYSPLQTYDDLIARGMNETYFTALYNWFDGPGGAIVADYLLNYPIERGAIPMRAPETTSTGEAVNLSRGPVERMVAEAVEDGLTGFRGGWISIIAAMRRIKDTGAASRMQAATLGAILESMGYRNSGRSPRPYFQEDRDTRATLYHWGAPGDVNAYGRAQGYE